MKQEPDPAQPESIRAASRRAARSTAGVTVRETVWRTGLAGIVAATLLSLLPASVEARAVTNAADPAFAGALTVSLPPAGMPPGATSHEFTVSGVTFRFESTNVPPNPLDGFGGLQVFSFNGPGDGVLVTISPPVPAIGFHGQGIDGSPGAVFVGAGGVETVFAPYAPSFFGAADIGDIGTVSLEGASTVFIVTQLSFVPPAPTVPGDADLILNKSAAAPASGGRTVSALNGDPVTFNLDLFNQGPDDAPDTVIVDFVPEDPLTRTPLFDATTAPGQFDAPSNTVTWPEGSVGAGAGVLEQVDITTPTDRRAFGCTSRLVNVGIAGSGAFDPVLANNVSTSTVVFDRVNGAAPAEIRNNGIDDDCDGAYDCADSECNCRPTLAVLPGGNPQCFGGLVQGVGPITVFTGIGCPAFINAAAQTQCRVNSGSCINEPADAGCCDASAGACNLPHLCLPADPNFKTSDPPVNALGYGYTAAGRTMTYTLHYENVGNADALDVQVIDVLDAALDDTTLVINDGGVYSAASRTIVWSDPVLPPATPRSVSFEVALRDDAPPGTRVRNTGTIVFPNAVPPSRVDTNFVEHVVPDPTAPIEPVLRVMGCNETAPGSGQWRVRLLNEGVGFAYDTTATLLSTPTPISVSDGSASLFPHPGDSAAAVPTVVPNAWTDSADTVAFTTLTPGDPCAALRWRITWDSADGQTFQRDVQSEPDGDGDAVADGADNCPTDFNPTQADEDSDGTGDACDAPAAQVCDADVDGNVDLDDVMAVIAARNTPASGPDDPRDADRDGQITVIDARACVRQCTNPGCAP